MTESLPILVLGMHRSGTSCLTGNLEQSGQHAEQYPESVAQVIALFDLTIPLDGLTFFEDTLRTAGDYRGKEGQRDRRAQKLYDRLCDFACARG